MEALLTLAALTAFLTVIVPPILHFSATATDAMQAASDRWALSRLAQTALALQDAGEGSSLTIPLTGNQTQLVVENGVARLQRAGNRTAQIDISFLQDARIDLIANGSIRLTKTQGRVVVS